MRPPSCSVPGAGGITLENKLAVLQRQIFDIKPRLQHSDRGRIWRPVDVRKVYRVVVGEFRIEHDIHKPCVIRCEPVWGARDGQRLGLSRHDQLKVSPTLGNQHQALGQEGHRPGKVERAGDTGDGKVRLCGLLGLDLLNRFRSRKG